MSLVKNKHTLELATTTLSPLQLQRFVSMREASQLSGLSEDSLKRHHSDKIKKLSPRRLGMRVADALMIGK